MIGLVLVINPYLCDSVALASEPVSVRMGTAGLDTYIKQDNTSQNNGTLSTFVVQSRNTRNWRTLLQFDLSSVAPGTNIKGGTLSLWQTFGTPRTHELLPLTEIWTETGATWSNRASLTPWSAPGGGTFGPAVSTATTALTFGGAVQIDFANLPANMLQTWVETPSTNNGFVIKDQNENSVSTQSVTYAGRTAITTTNRPLLTMFTMRNITWGTPSAPGPSQITLPWSFPAGSTSSHYNGVLIAGVEGEVAPIGDPTDGATYAIGDAVGTGGIVANTSSFATVSTTIENGDIFAIAPGTQYTFRAFTHDTSNLYASGVNSATVTTPISNGASDWSYATGATTLAPPAPTGSGTVIVGGNDNFVRAMNYGTGVRNYAPSLTAGNAGGSVQDRPTVIPSDFTSNPICAFVCDVVYASSSDGRVHAFRADTGTELWQSPVLTTGGGPLIGSPAVQLSNLRPPDFRTPLTC